MSPVGAPTGRVRWSFPRVSGDEPMKDVAAITELRFSPRERG